jgi:hypothetical protein
MEELFIPDDVFLLLCTYNISWRTKARYSLFRSVRFEIHRNSYNIYLYRISLCSRRLSRVIWTSQKELTYSYMSSSFASQMRGLRSIEYLIHGPIYAVVNNTSTLTSLRMPISVMDSIRSSDAKFIFELTSGPLHSLTISTTQETQEQQRCRILDSTSPTLSASSEILPN